MNGTQSYKFSYIAVDKKERMAAFIDATGVLVAKRTISSTTPAAATIPSTASTTMPSTASLATLSTKAIDAHELCCLWAGLGECTKNANFMLVTCKRSCIVTPDTCTGEI